MSPNLILASADPEQHVVAHGLFKLANENIALPFGTSVKEFWFTNHLLMLLVVMVLMLLVFVPIGRSYAVQLAQGNGALTPARGFRGLIEAFMDALRTSVVRPVLGDDTDRFMPFLWTLFFFILFGNLLGMVPIDAVANLFGKSHIGGTATGNVNVTGGLALVAFLMIHVSGVRKVYGQLVSGTFGMHHDEHGGGEEEHAAGGHAVPHHEHGGRAMAPGKAALMSPVCYLWNFAPHVFAPHHHREPGGLRVVMAVVYAAIIAAEYYGLALLFQASPEAARIAAYIGGAFGVAYALVSGGMSLMDLADVPMWGFFIPLEVIGALVKPFALCMRLFANMIAGHMVLASILALIPVFKGLTAGYLGMSLPIALGCVALNMLELFVAFLQAYIFMYLTTMFINLAINPEH